MQLESANKEFRNKFAEDIWNHKYNQGRFTSWAELCDVLCKEVCGGLMTHNDIDSLTEYMKQMKWLPGGRYLYYAGRGKKFWNNCGSAKTKLLTDKGWVTFGEVVGEEVNLYSPIEKTYTPAQVYHHGQQEIFEITFSNIKGKSKKTWKSEFTANHKWPLKSGKTTESLRVGDVVPAAVVDLADIPEAWIHGAVFADGNKHPKKYGWSHQLRLSGRKKDFVNNFSKHTVTYPPFAGGDPVVNIKSLFNMKELPSENTSPEYKASFIKAWISFDGHKNKIIHSTNRQAIEWLQNYAPLAGFVVTGEIRTVTTDSNFGPRQPLHILTIQKQEDFAGFKVVSIKSLGVQDVFCPFEPKHNQIVIEHGIHTFNCFLYRSMADTREDWSNTFRKISSALMTGGGIGNDYSIYRPSGQLIKSTGGIASGPIPAMQVVNDLGRQVMQGGARRSAMYASLNWKHGDIDKFLTIKDWHEIPVKGTSKTLWDLKNADFNFNAPLDMTNISVNYDTDWALKSGQGDYGEVFMKNVYQAMKTGEPGFSFNFFENENETLRNACTELTSEDDSDVCNLASINLSRIKDIGELKDVSYLVTQFQICATLRAELPHEEVYDIREKNRRLGQGLMGVHEWLLSRGYRYEMNPELESWLAAWRDVTDRTSRGFAARLSVSRPVKNRAIAPTGSIGILAGTTTGIEPLYAVAYKRRYLKEGTKWHYQYVVDSTAQELITNRGIDPEKIESSFDLAKDPERRIKFQADVQRYVDHAISSTINLPPWGSTHNNEDKVAGFAAILAKYALTLRGFTCYPDGSRGGQPLTSIPYKDAKEYLGKEFEEHVQTNDICEIGGKGGSCGS